VQERFYTPQSSRYRFDNLKIQNPNPNLKTMPENIITASNLTKEFDGQTAVADLSLNIPAGGIFGFIGPSGCGKTTTVRLMLGIYQPDAGEILVLGVPPARFTSALRTQIGYMPQQFVLYPELTVWENLNFAASIYGLPLRRRRRLRELLALVELEGHENKQVRYLSGGMQRRLSLATAIAHRPRLLFLDEPTTGIDPVLRRKFWDYFEHLKAQGHTLFVTTQYVGEAAYCDYVGVMAEGRLLMVETPEGLRRYAFGGDLVHIHYQNFPTAVFVEELRNQPFVRDRKVTRLHENALELVVEDASATLPLLLEWSQSHDMRVESANEESLPFDDVFVRIIEKETRHD
jgi:ABC-2 type transport system ATP-binding protein